MQVVGRSLKHVLILVAQLVTRYDSSLYIYCVKMSLFTFLVSHRRVWTDYFVKFTRAEDGGARLRDISINTVVIFQHSLWFTNLAGC